MTLPLSLSRSNSMNSTSNLKTLSNNSDRANGGSVGGNPSAMTRNIKLIGVGVLCFIGGMQIDRGSIVQINFSSHTPHAANRDVLAIEGEEVSASAAATAAATTDDSVAKAIADTTNIVRNTSETPVEKIVLLGERHSGTNWITDHLQECFGDRVLVGNDYTRYKHWFQEDTRKPNSAVVVAMFRDPMDWVEAMRWEPHHAHDHLHFHNNRQVELTRKEPTEDDEWWWQVAEKLPWKEFVTKPWVGRRGPIDRNLAEKKSGIESLECLDNYHFVDAAPCSKEDSPTLRGLGEYKYEYKNDGSERGFNSILDLRRDKIINHLSVADFSGTRAFFPYRFEELKANGTAALLVDLEKATGLKAKCAVIYGKDKNANGAVLPTPSIRHRQLAPKVITKKKILSKEYIEYMNRFVDWEVEKLIGYYPRQK